MRLNADDVKYIVVHCAATKATMDIGAADIDRWHRARGWSGCGYHGVIRRDGTLEGAEDGCRPLDVVGAHVRGHNRESVGICLAGGLDSAGEAENNFTAEQFDTLKRVLVDLKKRFKFAQILGHRDMPGVTKSCPCFDVAAWLDSEGGM